MVDQSILVAAVVAAAVVDEDGAVAAVVLATVVETSCCVEDDVDVDDDTDNEDELLCLTPREVGRRSAALAVFFSGLLLPTKTKPVDTTHTVPKTSRRDAVPPSYNL